jgi:hypothetical protein
MEARESQFDDPALKEALKRAFGHETAPAILRQRVTAAWAAEQRASALRARSAWHNPLSKLAVAAVLLIGFGVAYFILFRSTSVPIPSYFASSMLSAHDQCAGLGDHHLLQGVAGDDLAAVRQKLRQELGHPVLASSPGPDWTFAGAGICKVGDTPAAHLLYKRGDDTISIISINARAFSYSTQDGMTYEDTVNDHPISGFVKGGAVHCLIGSSKAGKLTLRELNGLRKKLKGSVSMGEPFGRVGGTCGLH